MSRLCPEITTKLYVQKFGFCTWSKNREKELVFWSIIIPSRKIWAEYVVVGDVKVFQHALLGDNWFWMAFFILFLSLSGNVQLVGLFVFHAESQKIHYEGQIFTDAKQILEDEKLTAAGFFKTNWNYLNKTLKNIYTKFICFPTRRR